MTPLIAEMVGIVPDVAADMVWFDINDAWHEKQETYNHAMALEGLQNPLPFMRCAIVVIEGNGSKTITMVANAIRPDRNDQSGLAVASIMLQHGKLGVFAPFFCDPFEENVVEKGLTIYFNDKKHDDDPKMMQGAMASLVAISFWLKSLNQEKVVSYQPQKRAGHAKRIRQGKKPMFDWRTVVLEPRVQKSEYLGGTHSSPRLHDVRGHWVVRGNKKFWRKPHKRGDASKGVIFHDYKLKGEKHDTERNCNFT